MNCVTAVSSAPNADFARRRSAPGSPVPAMTAAAAEFPSTPLPIAVLVSGLGTNLQALLDTVHGREAQIVAVASSREGAPALVARARWGSRRPSSRARCTQTAPRATLRLADWLPSRARSWSCSPATWSCSARSSLAASRSSNQCPSLPAARVPGPARDRAGAAYGVKLFGVTVHFVDGGVDTGPVIAQRAIELPGSSTRMRSLRGCIRSSTSCSPRS